MEAKRYGILDSSGKCINVVLWDGNLATWQPPQDCTVIQDDNINIYPLPSQPQMSEIEVLQQEIKTLQSQILTLFAVNSINIIKL